MTSTDADDPARAFGEELRCNDLLREMIGFTAEHEFLDQCADWPGIEVCMSIKVVARARLSARRTFVSRHPQLATLTKVLGVLRAGNRWS